MLFDVLNKEEEEIIVKSKEINAHLKSLLKWNEYLEISGRFTWLKVEGLPVQARNPNSFISIGRLWGEVVVTDLCDQRSNDWSFGQVCIFTSEAKIISESIEVMLKNKTYVVRIKEVEEKNGHTKEKMKNYDDADDGVSEELGLASSSDDE